MTESSLPTPDPTDRIDAWLADYRLRLRVVEQGRLVAIGDGIAWTAGLPSAAIDDILVFDDGSRALVFDLNARLIGGVLLQETDRLAAGTGARVLAEPLSIPAGPALLGRVVDPLGTPLDGEPPPAATERCPLQRRSPPMAARDFTHAPLETGTTIMDTLLPIGRGQRQLIIGDAGLGRSALALDAVINQRGRDVRCVYVLIGQKRSTVVDTIETLRRAGALEYTTIVVAEASAPAGLRYLAPMAGCALAEYWMHQGGHALVVYDDLSTHALTYRELALLLRRPPGREAYPGDIFSVHARLLERSACLDAAHGGGSMTALPIVETQQGEIAAYIPTNLISITDGQVYLDASLFAGAFRPAIDISRSVSRIGGAAQHPRIREEAGRMKLDYLRFLELETYTRFGAQLETGVRAALRRGRVLRALLRQDRLAPRAMSHEYAWLVAFNDGRFEGVDADDVPALMGRLGEAVTTSTLTLDHDRAAWSAATARWLADGEETP